MPTPDLSGATWRKSSRSNGGGGTCVEIAFIADATAVRDSKDTDGPALTFRHTAFHGFLGRIKSGRFDR